MRKLVVSLLVASGLTLTGVSSFAVDEPSQDAKMEQPTTAQGAAQATEIKGEVTSFKEDTIKLNDELGMTHSFDIARLENADELKANPLQPGDMVIVKLEGGKAISIERFEGDKQASAKDEQGAETAGEGEYVVKKGDTLSEIAEERLGSQDKWGLIAKANNLNDPDIIYVGQHLSIPSGSGMGQSGS
jgi:nucleoid-associated protein YgaU